MLDLTDPGNPTMRHSAKNLSMLDTTELKNKILPLLFGTSWKVLDLLIEHELNRCGFRPSRRNFQIKEKIEHAQKRSIDGSSLGCDSATWNTILDLYANTTEHRNCLVHRIAKVDQNTGELTGIDQNTMKSLTALTRDQQYDFSKCTFHIAQAIINDGISCRSKAELKYYLNKLSDHTHSGELPGAAIASEASIMMHFENDENGYFIEISKSMPIIKRLLPEINFFDIMIRDPVNSQKIYTCKYECMPPSKTYIDLLRIPGWLKEKQV